MRFLFVDRVLELERYTRIVAVRQIPLAEDLFMQHFPGRPMMPASLLIEALAQTATILVETSREFDCKALVGYVANSKFRQPVVPGFEMRLEMQTVSTSEDGAVLTGAVLQRGQRCVNAEIGMVIAPLGEFLGKVDVAHYHLLYDTWLENTNLSGFDRDPRSRLQRACA